MNKFCSNCGSQLESESNFCSKCGVEINGKVKVEGNGSSIASMVLGIIAICWAALELLSIGELEFSVPTNNLAELIGFFIGYNLLSLPTGIIGLVLGLNSKAKNKKSMAGIITSGLALVIVTISLIIMLLCFV